MMCDEKLEEKIKRIERKPRKRPGDVLAVVWVFLGG